jgi:hypothetical protein
MISIVFVICFFIKLFIFNFLDELKNGWKTVTGPNRFLSGFENPWLQLKLNFMP